jgi:hypothetical protein
MAGSLLEVLSGAPAEFVVLSRPPGVDTVRFWRPGQAGPEAITHGEPTDPPDTRVGLNFIKIGRESPETAVGVVEDGLTLTTPGERWQAVLAAVAAKQELTLTDARTGRRVTFRPDDGE